MCSGRGYLSVFLALAYPDIEFILFDNSKQTKKRYKSLVNILKNSKNCKLANITHYIRDIQYNIPELKDVRPDLLLGLHTCGGAADNIIKYGIDKKIPFFVVPCCHHLRNEINGFQNNHLKKFIGVKNLGEEVIRKAGFGGGLIVSSSNSIHSAVKPENYIEMIRTIHDYGKYPLDIN